MYKIHASNIQDQPFLFCHQKFWDEELFTNKKDSLLLERINATKRPSCFHPYTDGMSLKKAAELKQSTLASKKLWRDRWWQLAIAILGSSIGYSVVVFLLNKVRAIF